MRIATLETENNRLQMLVEHSQAIVKSTQDSKSNNDSDNRQDKEVSHKKDKCKYENIGTCRDHERCKYFHPKDKCEVHSLLGKCSQEVSENSSCDLRHPKYICQRLKSAGYCSLRDRHPLNYVVNEQASKRRIHNYNYYKNSHF